VFVEESLGARPCGTLTHYSVRKKSTELIQYPHYALKDVAGLVGFKEHPSLYEGVPEITGARMGEWRRKYQAGDL